VKNGISITGKQKYKCNACGRQFVINPAKFPIPDQTKKLIDKLLLERISLAGIARITGVSERRLQAYVNEKYQQVPRHVQVKKRVGDAWPSSAMNCGRSCKIAIINNGFG
jgi:transposase-like protein